MRSALHICMLLCCIALSLCFFTKTYSQSKEGFLIKSNPEGADVYIEGNFVGKTPCPIPFKLSGQYRITAIIEGYEKWSNVVGFNREEQREITIPLSPKKQFRSISRSLLLPGWGQHYAERKIEGKIFFGAQMISLVSLGFAQLHYDNCLDDYNFQLAEYNRKSKSFALEPAAWHELQRAHSQLDDAFTYRQIFIYSSICVYALNVLDSIFFFPKNIRKIEIFGLAFSEPKLAVHGSNLVFSWAL